MIGILLSWWQLPMLTTCFSLLLRKLIIPAPLFYHFKTYNTWFKNLMVRCCKICKTTKQIHIFLKWPLILNNKEIKKEHFKLFFSLFVYNLEHSFAAIDIVDKLATTDICEEDAYKYVCQKQENSLGLGSYHRQKVKEEVLYFSGYMMIFLALCSPLYTFCSLQMHGE